MNATTFALTLVASVLSSAVLTALVTAYAMRKKTTAEAEATLSGAVLAYSNKLSADNDKLRTAIDKVEADHEKSGAQIAKLRKDLDASEKRATQLKEIVDALESRKQNDQVIISKLVAALRTSDPTNPVLIELAHLSEFHILPAPPKA